MIDILGELSAIHRGVSTGSGGVGVLLRRTYPAPVEDVWDAVTDPDRLKRWFLPVSGDLRPGGRFQLSGHAGGEILRCEPPRLLKVTFGGEDSLVEVRLSAGSDNGTVLEVEHTIPIEVIGGGAGALYIGPGWDGGMLALSLYVSGVVTDDPVAASNSPEAVAFSRRSVHAWTAVVETSGIASTGEVAAAAEAAMERFGGGVLADALNHLDTADDDPT
jgi:uncharacterized protein YndB with AHSA1/START domain